MSTRLRKNNGTYINSNEISNTSYLLETTTLDSPPVELIDLTKPLRIADVGSSVRENDYNYNQARLLDLRSKVENDSSWIHSLLSIDYTNGIGVVNAPVNIATFSYNWNGNTLTTDVVQALGARIQIDPTGGSGRIHDCSAFTASSQISNGGYAYSSVTGISTFLDVRTTGNGKCYGNFVSLYLPDTAGCSELHGVNVHDYGTENVVVSTGKKYAFSLNDSSYNTRYFVTLDGKQLKLTPSAPTSSNDTGVIGSIRIDDSYVYICTATNTWKRVSLSTF